MGKDILEGLLPPDQRLPLPTGPVNQIVGYIMSGDPTYITSYNGARSLVMKVERDEIVEELLKAYIKNEL